MQNHTPFITKMAEKLYSWPRHLQRSCLRSAAWNFSSLCMPQIHFLLYLFVTLINTKTSLVSWRFMPLSAFLEKGYKVVWSLLLSNCSGFFFFYRELHLPALFRSFSQPKRLFLFFLSLGFHSPTPIHLLNKET